MQRYAILLKQARKTGIISCFCGLTARRMMAARTLEDVSYARVRILMNGRKVPANWDSAGC